MTTFNWLFFMRKSCNLKVEKKIQKVLRNSFRTRSRIRIQIFGRIRIQWRWIRNTVQEDPRVLRHINILFWTTFSYCRSDRQQMTWMFRWCRSATTSTSCSPRAKFIRIKYLHCRISSSLVCFNEHVWITACVTFLPATCIGIPPAEKPALLLYTVRYTVFWEARSSCSPTLFYIL